jgi:outer membrane protein assembly factor BamA
MHLRVSLVWLASLLVGVVDSASAQPAQKPPDDVLEATQFDPTTCEKKPSTDTPGGAQIPVVWSDFDLTGTLRDPMPIVRDLLAPTMNRHHALTEDAREDIIAAASAFGYHVVGLGTREVGKTTHASVHLAPLPIIRHVDVSISQHWYDTLFRDEVRRRMRLRAGGYLPWSPAQRACQLLKEKQRTEDYLHDEGYFDATAKVDEVIDGDGTSISVAVELNEAYTTAIDRIKIDESGKLPIDVSEIREKFRHPRCLLRDQICRGYERFTRAQHQLDLLEVYKLFHTRGYPSVRVRSDFSPGMSIDRRRKTVSFGITIDPRRHIDVRFEGIDGNTDNLHKQLTFDKAASADDVEANESARALAAYLQSQGFFDARVTWRRESFPEANLDHVIFRIDQGRERVVRAVSFTGNQALKTDVLTAAIGTKPARLSTTLLGANTAATSAVLASDVDRLVNLYRRNGYRDVRVRVRASTDPRALDSVALTAALLVADRGEGLYIQFSIDEGLPTLLTQVRVELGDKGDQVTTDQERALCAQVLKDLSTFYHHDPLAQQAQPDRCIAVATNLAFREEEATDTRDLLKDRLFSRGRPRTEVSYEAIPIEPHRVAVRYKLESLQELKVGKIVIRGNFRTRDSIIRGRLKLKEGQPLTTEALAESTRALRNTALFDSVNIKMPDLDTTSAGAVNAVIEVTERYDFFSQVDLEAGYSSYNGAFVKLIPSFHNLFGVGISLDLSGTIGFDLGKLFDQGDLALRQLSGEAALRIPAFLSPIGFQTDLIAFHRRQDTPRFGLLRTTGATIGLSRTWERQRVGTRPARALTLGFHYDFRSRERNVDVLRPVGADEDESQVPITTRTGSVGTTFEWEQRVSRSGTLSPLAPESGFRFDAQVSIAHPYLCINPDFCDPDTFIKASFGGSKYFPLGTNLVLRTDFRYDHGFPLGGASLLPEIERFFGGGDSTVRGYNDDRLATEIVQVSLPPLENLTQIRILPAGGNIRMLGSADLQLRVYKLVYTALFFDAGIITNQWSTVTTDDIRPSVGMALIRVVTPFGAFAFERAVPLRPRLGDDPRGRWHISFAARAQF